MMTYAGDSPSPHFCAKPLTDRCSLAHTMRASLLLMAALPIAGCYSKPHFSGLDAGDDGGVDAASDVPRVLSTTPSAGAAGAEPEVIVQATFSADMNPATIDATTFLVTSDGLPVAGTATYAVGSRTATFSPDVRLTLLHGYSATITSAVAGVDATPIAGDYTWGFTTRDGVWGAAAVIETDDAGNAQSPAVATDARGDAVAVWHQSSGGATMTNVRSNRFVAGTGWGTATPIETNTIPNPVAPVPDVAVNDTGDAVAVWCESDGTRANVWANRYVSGAGWGTATLIETNNAGGAQSPKVALDADGNATAVWAQSDGTRDNIWANRYVAGSGWATATLIETGGGFAASADVAVDPAGNVVAVWYQYAAVADIWANRYVPGAGWGVATRIETDDTGSAIDARISVDHDGNAIAVWKQHDGTRYNIWANRYAAGSGWGTSELIETDGGAAEAPGIAVDGDGNAIAIWDQSDGTRNNIWVNRYVVGSGWGTAMVIETDNGMATNAQIAFDATGNAVAVWPQSDGSRTNIWANRYVSGSGWNGAVLIESDNAGDAYSASLAVDPGGNAVVAWEQTVGTLHNIAANTFR